MGTLAAGGAISAGILFGAIGASFILLSLYPVSQVFQIDADRERNDETFALVYGVNGIKKFFLISFTLGSIILCGSVILQSVTAGVILITGTAISGIIIARLIIAMEGKANEYSIVMKTKFFASLSFVCFFLAGNVIRHGWLS